MSFTKNVAQTTLLDASFSSVVELCDTVEQWDLDFRPFRRELCRPFARVTQLSAGDIDHSYARFGTPLDQRGAAPAKRITFTVLGPGTRLLWWRGHQVCADQILVYEQKTALQSWSGDDFETNVVSVAPGLIAALCEQLEIAEPSVAHCGEVFRARPAEMAEMRRQLTRLVSGGGSSADYHALVETLLWRWAENGVAKPVGNGLRGERNRARAMRRCLEFLNQRNIGTLTTADLRDMSRVSARTLEYAFRERFGIGPAAFIKMAKLRFAHELLADPDSALSSVADAMDAAGFWHVGQFARDYWAAYGETPSQTLARVQGPVPVRRPRMVG